MRDRRSLREPADAEGAGSPGSSGGGIDDEITGRDDLAHGPLRASSSADQAGPLDEPALDGCADRSAPVPHGRTAVRTWPLLILALPASIAVWSGWVGIGQMTGFGEIRPFPGIWNSFHLDTAVTLPVGVEAYAAFALRAWLTSNPAVSDRTRRFARWSAISAMALGMSGQVAYHLLTQAGVTRAPWGVTTLVSCLPVLVLGMGSALAHLLRSDSAAARAAAGNMGQFLPAGTGRPDRSAAPLREPADQGQYRTLAKGPRSAEESAGPRPDDGTSRQRIADGARLYPGADGRARPPARIRIADAKAAASKLITSGQRISRRSLRSAGMQGSNADLGMLARYLRAAPPSQTHLIENPARRCGLP